MNDLHKDTSPSTFRAELLAELVEMVESDPAPAAPARRGGPNGRRIATLAAAGLAAAAAGVTGTVMLGSPPAQAAPFTVVKEPDGSVRFTIREYRNPAGLQAELRAAGVNAVVDYLQPGQRCGDGRFTPYKDGADIPEGIVDWVRPPDRIMTDAEIAYHRQGWQEIRPARIPAGTTLVMSMTMAEQDAETWSAVGTNQLAVGEVGSCNPVDDDTIARPTIIDGMPGAQLGLPSPEASDKG
ncbi:hypothetical protein [Yinghuangia soli]|uniref:Uncharacterized protein n=1 Tax=Yinghuangia soli TaxID=2908204 RepID=A0AA41U261_9ACTN|nr:hypothetical protein [Yinghuangia soli]MCF2530340.1 hypothetical protein [Yinghuangia soli]